MTAISRKAKKLLGAPVATAIGYYGALLAKLSHRQHERFMRRRLRGPYKGPVAEKLATIMIELDRNQDPQRAMQDAVEAVREGLDRGEFDNWINKGSKGDGKTNLIKCANFLPGRSWKLQLFYIPEGHSHAPHSHSDVASCLVVAKGTLHAREYDRFHDQEDDPHNVLLSLASDRRLSPRDALLTTRASRDVHWFGAIDGPAVAFNFQAVGFTRGRKALEYRRIYVDPTGVPSSGMHKAPKLKSNDAQGRFEHQPLSAFPIES